MLQCCPAVVAINNYHLSVVTVSMSVSFASCFTISHIISAITKIFPAGPKSRSWCRRARAVLEGVSFCCRVHSRCHFPKNCTFLSENSCYFVVRNGLLQRYIIYYCYIVQCEKMNTHCMIFSSVTRAVATAI